MPLTKSVSKNMKILDEENKSKTKPRSRPQMIAIAMSAAGKSNERKKTPKRPKR